MVRIQWLTLVIARVLPCAQIATGVLALWALAGCDSATVAQPIEVGRNREAPADEKRRDSGPALQTAKALEIERLPIPDDEQVAKSRKLLREIYGEEVVTATDDREKVVLAEKLLSMAETSKSSADTWALLQAAKTLAVDASDANLIHRVCVQIGRRFVVDRYEQESEALLLLSDDRSLPEESAATAKRLIALVPVALGRDAFEQVQHLADAANRFATRSRNAELAKESLQLLEELKAIKPVYLEAEEARRTLSTDARNAEANLKQGRFLCFVRGQWPAGLPLLAQGSEPELADLAKRDADGAVDADEMLALGDAWWEYSDEVDDVLAKQVRLHAAHWYQRGLPKFEGLQRAKVEKRIAETREIETPLDDPTATATGGGGGWHLGCGRSEDRDSAADISRVSLLGGRSSQGAARMGVLVRTE